MFEFLHLPYFQNILGIQSSNAHKKFLSRLESFSYEFLCGTHWLYSGHCLIWVISQKRGIVRCLSRKLVK